MKQPQFPIEQIRAVIREELEGVLAQLKENFNPESTAMDVPVRKINGTTYSTIQPELNTLEEAISAKLSMLIGDYSQEKIRSGIWSQRTQEDNHDIGELIVKILRDVGVSGIGFEEARKNGYVKENYFKGLQLPKHKSAKDERLPFSDVP